MSTRHADTFDLAKNQGRYMSSPEFTELRGICGTAVSTKAAMLVSARQRSLLYWLQSMFMEPGGRKKFVSDFLASYPERLGSPTMHKLGVKAGQVYRAEDAEQIQMELRLFRNKDRRVETFLDECRKQSATLEDFLLELCLNPKVEFQAPGETDVHLMLQRLEMQHLADIQETDFQNADVNYFKDIIPALFDFQKRYAENVRKNFVMTNIGQAAWDTLDFGLETGKMVVIEGDARLARKIHT